MKQRIYEILETGEAGDKASKTVDGLIIGLILLNIVAVLLESVPSLSTNYKDFFFAFEWFSVAVFSIEYLLRFWTITSAKKYSNPISGRFKYLFSASSLIDLIAIVPTFIPIFWVVDTRTIRALRLLRLFRIMKIGRYGNAFKMIRDVIHKQKEELLISLGLVLILLVVASTMMFHIEHDTQPDAFSSIPATMWWGVATLTTVGYGDIYPVTGLGKFLGGIMAILGVGLFALPAGILANGFNEEMSKKRNKIEGKCITCPHCNKELKEE
jgi:voltage-gated potassium channel